MPTVTVTQAGIQAVVDAQGDGLSGVQLQTLRVVDLAGATHDLAVVAVAPVSPGRIHVTATDATADDYEADTLDVVLDSGTVFAEVRREAGEANLFVKTGAASSLLSFVLVVAAAGANPVAPMGNVQFPAFQAATTGRMGVVELATTAETLAGTDPQRAVTPATLAGALAGIDVTVPDATTGRKGIVELATLAEHLGANPPANRVATAAGVRAVRDALLNSPPGALDTLNELAAALGDDPNFSATVMALINSLPTQAQGDARYLRQSEHSGREIIAWADVGVSVGIPSIQDSFNFASIIDNGVGSYTLNFSENPANANYAAVATVRNFSHVNRVVITSKVVGSVGVQTSANAVSDRSFGLICVGGS